MEEEFLENDTKKEWRKMNSIANEGIIYQQLYCKKGVKLLIDHSDEQTNGECYDDIKSTFPMIEFKNKAVTKVHIVL